MHPNEQLIRELYDAMARADGRRLAQFLTAETKWIMPGRGHFSGTYTGPDEIFGFWKRVAQESGGGLQLELRDVLANDDRAVALISVHGRREDRHLDQRQVVVFEFLQGMLLSGTFIYEDPEAYEGFWS
jgi:ketosteroid isomerase-like protein